MSKSVPSAVRRSSSARPIVLSDQLPQFLELLSLFPTLRELAGDVIRVDLVLDASVVYRELRWRVKSRPRPGVRSALHETIQASVVCAIAPLWIEEEIREHLPEIAEECNVSCDVVDSEWQEFKKVIRFYRPNGTGGKAFVSDADDLPYAITCLEIAASAVYTSDKHFDSANVPVLKADLDLLLCDYARSTAVVVGVRIGAHVTVSLSLVACAALIKKLAEFVGKLPTEVKVCAGLILAGVLIHPTSRRKILEWAKKGFDELARPDAVVAPLLAEVAQQYYRSKEISAESERVLKHRIPPPPRKRVPAIVLVRKFCLRAARPLAASEIADLLKKEGYRSRARNLDAYVGRLMREGGGFVRNSGGKWSLQAS